MPGRQVAGWRGGVGRRWGRGRRSVSARRRGVALQLRLWLPLGAPLELDGLLDGVRVDELHHADLLGYGLAHLLRGQVRDLRQGIQLRNWYREGIHIFLKFPGPFPTCCFIRASVSCLLLFVNDWEKLPTFVICNPSV